MFVCMFHVCLICLCLQLQKSLRPRRNIKTAMMHEINFYAIVRATLERDIRGRGKRRVSVC